MSFVGGEVIPKIVEVGAFATSNQSFGRRAIEAEMPNAGVVVNWLPTTHARQESIHQDELRHLRRKLGSIGIGDHKTDVMPNDFCFLNAKRFGQRMNTDGGTLHVQTVGGNV